MFLLLLKASTVLHADISVSYSKNDTELVLSEGSSYPAKRSHSVRTPGHAARHHGTNGAPGPLRATRPVQRRISLYCNVFLQCLRGRAQRHSSHGTGAKWADGQQEPSLSALPFDFLPAFTSKVANSEKVTLRCSNLEESGSRRAWHDAGLSARHNEHRKRACPLPEGDAPACPWQ